MPNRRLSRPVDAQDGQTICTHASLDDTCHWRRSARRWASPERRLSEEVAVTVPVSSGVSYIYDRPGGEAPER